MGRGEKETKKWNHSTSRHKPPDSRRSWGQRGPLRPSRPAAGLALQSREGGPARSAGLSPPKLATTSAGPAGRAGILPSSSRHSLPHFKGECSSLSPGLGKRKPVTSWGCGPSAYWSYWPWVDPKSTPLGHLPDSRGRTQAELVKVGFLTHILNSPHSMGSKPSCR